MLFGRDGEKLTKEDEDSLVSEQKAHESDVLRSEDSTKIKSGSLVSETQKMNLLNINKDVTTDQVAPTN